MEASGHPPPSRHLGLDLGGTNIKWVVVERDAGEWRVLDRDQVTTPTAAGPEAVVAPSRHGRCRGHRPLPGRLLGRHRGPRTVRPGLGHERASWSTSPGRGPIVRWPVRSARPSDCPAVLINDARAFGLAELRLGAGRGASSMIGLTLGTGVGGVIAVDGRVHQGHDGTAGEIGHQTIEPDGPWCGCGNRGCLEAFARADQIVAACGTATVEEAIAEARAGDTQAMEGLAQIARYLGIGIANMIVVISPDRVVIGGGIAAASDLLLGPIRDELRRRVRTTSLEAVQIVTAELGTWAGAIGAAIHGAEMAEP